MRKKTQLQEMKIPNSERNVTKKEGQGLASKIAVGATGVALTASAIAAGAALARKETREMLSKGATRVINSLKEAAGNISETAKESYMTVAHQVQAPKKGRRKKARK